MAEADQMVNVRHMVDDVGTAIGFYTEHLGFEVPRRPTDLDRRPLRQRRRAVPARRHLRRAS